MKHQGRFKPLNPIKYKGNPLEIFYRSSWELQVMRRFDSDPNILQWQSEELPIAYRDPVRGRLRKYFVDFWCKIKDKNGVIKELLIEVKPKAQTIPPQSINGKPTKKQLYEITNYVTNKAKWDAAEEYCKVKGMQFVILTEDNLFLPNRKAKI